jgi:threonine dehydrogenase-like Zn-dependent dehydrogenase
MVVADDITEPVPRRGQALVAVRACGICGSDLHFAHHGAELLELSAGMVDGPLLVGSGFDIGRDVFMGHELCAEVLELGPGTTGPRPGRLVTSIPALLTQRGAESLGYTNNHPAGYSERMLLSVPLLRDVPNGLPAPIAALTEPMAVAVRAVNRSGIVPAEPAVVLGCGPIGLGILAVLRARGVERIIAADYSPARRALALRLGANEVVDPAFEEGLAAGRRLAPGTPLVVFEAVGVPGVLNEVLRSAPHSSRVLVAGVCMQTDALVPYYAAGKELTVIFSWGYDLDEFTGTLHDLAEGCLNVAPLVTKTVSLDQVPAAFDELAHPGEQAKVTVEPSGPA